jgi:hypothetical protein
MGYALGCTSYELLWSAAASITGFGGGPLVSGGLDYRQRAMHKLGSGQLRRWRAQVFASAAVLIATVVSGCAREADVTLPTTSVSSTVTESGGGSVTSYDVDELSLRFDLPQNYAAVDDDELVFLARSSEPPSIFSIDREESGIVHDPEPGESVSEMRLGDVDAQVVTNAVLDGLPPGIAANELLVDNGPQSFSVIMSANPSDLADMWDRFIASIEIEPA